MSEKKLVPKKRFESFKSEWIEKSLNEISESFTYGLNVEAIEYDGENKYLRITDIDDITRKFNKNELTSPHIDYEISSDYILSEGDILFARTGASVGKTYRYSKLDGIVYYAGFLIKARIKKEHDIEFIFQNTLTKEYKRFVYVTSQRSGQPGINAQEYSTFKLFTPTIEEQQKIGAFFKVLDDRITNQERKLAKVKALKDAYLTEMFPQEGETVPKRRFKGFEDEWRKDKLMNIAETYSGGTPSITSKLFYNGDIPFIRSGEIGKQVTNLHITEEGLTNSSARLVNEGDILYALYGATSGEVSISKINGAINQAVLAIEPKNDNDNHFLVYWLKKHKQKIIETQLQGGQGNLSGELIRKTVIDLPSKEEQQKIGEFFKNLDNQIEMEKKKLDKLQKMKEAYLEEMFV